MQTKLFYGKDLSAYALEDYTVPRHVMIKL
jgi:hypothetical protein